MSSVLKTPLWAALLALTVTACGRSTPEPVSCNNLPANVTYTNRVKSYLESNCTECHSSSKSGPVARRRAPADVNYDSYTAAKSGAEAGAKETQEGTMPEGKTLSDEERCVLRAWVTQGTPE